MIFTFTFRKFFSDRRGICLPILFLMMLQSIRGQEFKIIKLNTSLYPQITATFVATDKDGNRILNAQMNDFKIMENKSAAEIVNVRNPSVTPMPVSVVLVFDNSLSMAGSRLNMALKAGRYFIEQMPLETSEIAIASFSNHIYVNCDFTQDPQRLYAALNSIKIMGGTDYTEAFLNQAAGALSISRNGRFKKYVIFLTDGLSNTDASKVIQVATEQNTTVFCVTLELVTPQVLKEISTKTGGTCFQTNANSDQLEWIYGEIFQMLDVKKYGSITWNAPVDCSIDKEVQLNFRQHTLKFNYQASQGQTGEIITNPNTLVFGTGKAGVKKNLSFDLIAHNMPVTITNLKFNPQSSFSLNDTLHLPFTLNPNQIQQVNVSFTPGGNKQITNKLVISSKECTDKEITLLGGTDEELKIITPRAGDIFLSGVDTAIRWDGIKKDRSVEIQFRINPKSEWMSVGNGKNLYKQWKVPTDTGSRLQIRVHTVSGANDQLFLTSTIPNQRGGVKSISFNAKGDHLLTSDQEGNLKVWNVVNGNEVSDLSSVAPKGYSVFGKDDQTVLFFSKNEVLTWSRQSQTLVSRQYIPNKIILTPFTLPSGRQTFISSIALPDNTGNLKIWMPEASLSRFILEKSPVMAAGLSIDGSKAITLSRDNEIKIWDTKSGQGFKSKIKPINPQSIIISPNAKTTIINSLGIMTIMDLQTGSELFHFQRYTPPTYSKSGDMLIMEEDSKTYFIDSYTGKNLFSLNKGNSYETFSNRPEILFYRNDSLTLVNPKLRLKIFQQYLPAIQDIAISPDEGTLMILRTHQIEFFNALTGDKLSEINDIEAGFRSAIFNPNKKGIMVVMKNSSLQYWSTEGPDNTKEATSGYFSVVSPKPSVRKSVDFQNQHVSKTREKSIEDFISNPTPYPARIEKIEIVSGDTSDYSIVSETGPFTLGPRSTKTVEIRFMPSSAGFRKSYIRTCTPVDTFITQLSGTGIVKDFSMTKNIEFGKYKVGNSHDTLSTLIRNKGNQDLRIKSIENFGPDKNSFGFKTRKNVVLLPGDSLQLNIRFSPAQRGKTSGNIAMIIDGNDSPEMIELGGEGIAPRTLLLKGQNLNSTDSSAIQSDVELIDLTSGTVISKKSTTIRGFYDFQINADRNYGIISKKKGFLATSENVDVRHSQQSDTIYRDLFLTPIRAGAMIRMNCIFFESGKAGLLDASRSELDRIADFLKDQKSITVEILGHTDSIGTDASNILLSKARANAVKNYFVKKGIDPARLLIIFFGESLPVSTNSTEEGRQMNRRVELKIKTI